MNERQAREIVYERSRGVCELCARGWATNWHHRVNQGQGGLWTPSNGLHLCGSGTTGCHGWVTTHPTKSIAHGWTVPAGEDPRLHPAVVLGVWCYLTDAGDLIRIRGRALP